MSFEHHIESARLAQRITIWTFNPIFDNRRIHLLHRHAIWVNAVVFEDMVGAVAAMINRVLTQRINKRIDMPARPPNLLIHQNRRVDAIHIVALIDEHFPPQIHDVALQSDAQRTIIPSSAKTTINIRPLINKAAALRQTHQIFHLHFAHKKSFLSRPRARQIKVLR